MRQASRAVIIRDNSLLVMKRNKFGSEYYVLIGGGVDMGETIEKSLLREVKEETGLEVSQFRKVWVEEAGPPYGTQHIFLCNDPGGEPQMQPDSDEASLNARGQNTYHPVWLPLDQLASAEFRSGKLKHAIITAVKQGFPEAVVVL